ncbi:hypothetical protein JQC67_00365 [Aurantibacter crassamenti]|nr:hypothetical protein [Aurantibacter crassamenti]MBM1104577.1 hypothetical protein [Aurantibacter crassamenti]
MSTSNNYFDQNARVGKTRSYNEYQSEVSKHLDLQPEVGGQENEELSIG